MTSRECARTCFPGSRVGWKGRTCGQVAAGWSWALGPTLARRFPAQTDPHVTAPRITPGPGRRAVAQNAPGVPDHHLDRPRAAPPTSGFLLHKHPARAQSFDLPVGRAHVFYPEATDERCTAALLLEVDPVAWSRGRAAAAGDASLLASTSTTGRTRRRRCSPSRSAGVPHRAHRPLRGPARARRRSRPAESTSRPCRATAAPTWSRPPLRAPGLDRRRPRPCRSTRPFPAWGDSRYVDLTPHRAAAARRRAAHLYVLLPGARRRQALLGRRRRGRQAAARRRGLAGRPPRAGADHHAATSRTSATWSPTRSAAARRARRRCTGRRRRRRRHADASRRARRPLAGLRREAVLAALADAGARRVVDLGCGEGALLARPARGPALHRGARRRRLATAPGARRAAAAPGDRCPTDSATGSSCCSPR